MTIVANAQGWLLLVFVGTICGFAVGCFVGFAVTRLTNVR